LEATSILTHTVIEQLDNRRREFFLGGTMLIFCAIMPFFLSSIVDCNVKRGKGFELKNLHDTYFVRREYINNDGKRIILMPMSHVGQKEFYERLIENISPDEKLIFIDEGIRYNKKEQVKKITENINKIIKKKEDYVCQNDYFYTLIKDFNRVNGDVHVDDLHPILRKDYLNQELNEKEKEILKDLYITEKINKRDEIAVAKMKEIYDDYNVFIFPWGASHMIGIEKLISESGFVEEESRKFNVLFIRQEIIYLRIIKWLYDTIKT